MTRIPIAPSIVLSAMIASAYAALYNLLRHGSLRDLFFCLAAAWAGFALGQAGGYVVRLNWGMIGSIYVIEGSIFCWLVMLMMDWLRLPRKRRQPH